MLHNHLNGSSGLKTVMFDRAISLYKTPTQLFEHILLPKTHQLRSFFLILTSLKDSAIGVVLNIPLSKLIISKLWQFGVMRKKRNSRTLHTVVVYYRGHLLCDSIADGRAALRACSRCTSRHLALKRRTGGSVGIPDAAGIRLRNVTTTMMTRR